MKTQSLLHRILVVVVDILIVNLGLFMGLITRYLVFVTFSAGPRLLPYPATPDTLWRETVLAFRSGAPLLTVLALAVFAASGFYRGEQLYRFRTRRAITQATTATFLLFAAAAYMILVLGPDLWKYGLGPIPRSAQFAGWGFTFALLQVARQVDWLWGAAREGRLPSQLVRNRYFFVSDVLVVILSAWLSFVARLDDTGLASYRVTFLVFLAAGLVCKPLIFYVFNLYRRYWRYASVGEAVLITEANLAASVGAAVLAYVVAPNFASFPPVPRSIPFIDFLFTTACVATSRFMVRVLSDRRIRARLRQGSAVRPGRIPRVLIVGAGDAGAMLVREIQGSVHLNMEPVGFVDDDPSKQNIRILGIPVLGTRTMLPWLIRELSVNEVIVAMPTAPGVAIRQVRQLCQAAGVTCKVLPGIYEVINGQVRVSQLRPVRIDDLLRRDPVEIDRTALGMYLTGVRILVTGAGGSIGSELCRQVANLQPRQLVLVGHGEYSIYSIERELRKKFPELDLVACIADVRDPERLDRLFAEYRPNVVFHAAAHKHVPLMESNVEEAVTNNVLGTQCVLAAAIKHNVARFVLISSDKAVNPVSVMGASKRVTEMLLQDAARRAAGVFVAVRFGNVLGSRGSVVPLFQEQIAAGGPITITDPAMERFFMTIPEAVNLVLQAGALGRSGAIYMLDMGQPVRIVDLARDMIELSGLRPDDIEIRFTGTRPGEKITEELASENEDMLPTTHTRIHMLRGVLSLDSRCLDEAVRELVDVARAGDDAETRTRLMELALMGRGPETAEADTSERAAPADQTAARLQPRGEPA